MIGREPERRRIERLVTDAQRGSAAALALVGEAGIGKTTLLDVARDYARAVGLTVLETRGVEAEAAVPFAGLAGLLGPVGDHLGLLPARQRDALAAALALGGPAPTDTLTLGTATLALLDAVADETPLVALVDDVHWLDAESAAALLFAARRLGAERVALLLALRPADGAAPELDRELEGVERLELAGLGEQEAAALLSRVAGATVPGAVARRIVAATDGNPLALVELERTLTPEQLAGVVPLDDPLPVAVGIERSFRRRIAALDAPARRALLLVAAGGEEELTAVAAAATDLGTEVSALEAAERAGLVALDGNHVRFRHPLVRSAAYHGAEPADRRAAHRALAARMPADRAAWHLAAAAVGPDPDAADALEAAAGQARSRAGYGVAAAALERAARLSADPAERRRRLAGAAEDALLSGAAQRGAALAAEVLEGQDDGDPHTALRARCVIGRTEMLGGSLADAHRMLFDAAEQIAAAGDPAGAVAIMVDGVAPLFMSARLPLALSSTERLYELGRQAGGPALHVASVLRAGALTLTGSAPDAVVRPMFARHRELPGGPLGGGFAFALSLTHFLGWQEEYATVVTIAQDLVDGARDAGALAFVPLALGGRCDAELRAGDWTAARAHASESVRMAEATGQQAQVAFPLMILARIDAATGAEADCRARVARALAIAEPAGMDSMPIFADVALGLLELGQGRPERAAEHLAAAAHRTAQMGMRDPSVVPFGADLVEALQRAGRAEEARVALAVLEAQAERTLRSWPRAAAARARGLLAPDDEIDAHFAAALELHAAGAEPFEQARTQLAYGERLRRARRRVDAREPLRAAFEGFDALGATPWARRAAAEIRAAGGAAPAAHPPRTGALTPQELEVAMLVARGQTNREVAAALFVSPKTVEAHLARIYRKLGVRSRTELAGLMMRSPPSSPSS